MRLVWGGNFLICLGCGHLQNESAGGRSISVSTLQLLFLINEKYILLQKKSKAHMTIN